MELLGQLLALTQEWRRQWQQAESDFENMDFGALLPLLDQREQLLARLAALPAAARAVPDAQPLVAALQALEDEQLAALALMRERLSSSQSNLRTGYSAMQAYMTTEQVDSRFIEEQS